MFLRKAVAGVIKRERRVITGQSDNIGHLFLGGIDGTGKTTVALALRIAVAVLLEFIVPVTWSYEDDRRLQPTGDGNPFSACEMIARGPGAATRAGGLIIGESLAHLRHSGFMIAFNPGSRCAASLLRPGYFYLGNLLL